MNRDEVTDPDQPYAQRNGTSLLVIAVQVGVFLTAAICPLDFAREGGKMSVGLDPLVAAKLAVSGFCCLLGLSGLVRDRRVIRTLASIPGMMVAGILIFAIVGSFGSVSPSALPAALVNLSYLVFVPYSLLVIGLERFVRIVAFAITLAMLLAWMLYWFLPAYGVFPEDLGDGIILYRLGGIGHPNSVGRSAALGAISVSYLCLRCGMRKQIGLAMLVILLASLLLAQSRTASVACLIAIASMCLHRLPSIAGLFSVAIVGLVTFAVMLYVVAEGEERRLTDRFVGLVSKSGRVEELTSGTGRTEIWSESIRLIRQKPLTGHGFGAAIVLLDDFSQSTHNVVLHAAMVSGLVGALLMVGLQIWGALIAIFQDHVFVKASALFVLVSGLFEDSVLATFPGPATLIWLAAILFPIFSRLPSEQPD